MPIYQYNCTACEHQFEKFVRKMDSNSTETCPECGQEAEQGIARVSPFVWGRGGSWS